MNVVQAKRKKAQGVQRSQFIEFNRIDPATSGDVNASKNKRDKASHKDQSFSTVATRGNSVVKKSSTYVSITSGRGYAHGEVGIACIDIESPDLKLIQLSDDPWYSGLIIKLHIIDPCQIILSHTSYDAKPETAEGKLMKFLREEFPEPNITKVPRRHFNDTDGMDLVKKYCSDKYNYAKDAIAGKYYALSAASGLIKYLQFIHNIYFKENSLKLDFDTKFAHMQIDIETAYKLELLSQVNPNTIKAKYPSLFDVINYCVTSLGKRTLRARILEPMCDIPSIKDIHDCIAEFRQDQNIELSPILSNILRNFNNIERLHKLALIVPRDDNLRAAEILINQTLHLKRCLKLIPVLRNNMATLKSKKLREIRENLLDERYESILNHIETVINPKLMDYRNDSGSQLHNRIDCIQTGVNELIDMLRIPYKDLIAQLEVLIAGMSTKYGQAFKMNYSVHKGFHVQLMIPNSTCIQDFPDELEVLEVKRNTCYLTTTEVNKLNIRIKSVIEEITMQSNVVIAVMLGDIVKEIDAIYDLSGFVATLDIIISLTIASSNAGYVCPTFGEEMRIVDAIHPLLEHNIHQTVARPNNVIATPEYNFFVITGPNMSGKTIYIKMIAFLQVMAQVGCYVPAKSAQFRITDRVFSRIGLNDSIQKNASTFVMEMNTMEHILKNVTPNSLVIIDELCRSTSPAEGAQLAWNLCEYLCSVRGTFSDGKYFVKDNMNDEEVEVEDKTSVGATTAKASTSTKCSNWKNTKLSLITAPFVFLTTHYHSLTKLADVYFNIVNLSFSAEEIESGEQRSLKYDHRIKEGVTTSTSYGLALAKTVKFPRSVIKRANEIHQYLTSGENVRETQMKSHKPKLSDVGNKLIIRMPKSQLKFDRTESLISEAIGGTIKRHRNPMLARSRTDSVAAATISSQGNEDHLAIDRLFYNAFGDIASIMRRVQNECEANFSQSCDGSANSTIRNAQNEAVKKFLFEFIQQQPDTLIEAIANLDLSQQPVEQSNNLSKSERNFSETTSSDKVSETVGNATVSSIFSNQDKTAQGDGISISNDISKDVVDYHKSVSNTVTLPNDLRFAENYEDWANDEFEKSLNLDAEFFDCQTTGIDEPFDRNVLDNESYDGEFDGSMRPETEFGERTFNFPERFPTEFEHGAFNETSPEFVSPFNFTGSESLASNENTPFKFEDVDTQRLSSELGNDRFRAYKHTPIYSDRQSDVSLERQRSASITSVGSITSSDSQTMPTFKRSIRKIPAPRRSKLKMPMVFGNMSQIFAHDTRRTLKQNPIPIENSNRFSEQTETNYIAAHNRLKSILERRHLQRNEAPHTQTIQQTTSKNTEIQQSDGASNKAIHQSTSTETITDIISPPSQFN